MGEPLTLAQLDRSTVMAAPRVVVVDDHRSFAELLSGALQAAGMDVVGTAHSAAQGVAMAQDLQPDIVVMDIHMPRQDGRRCRQGLGTGRSCKVRAACHCGTR
jgi:DNA-binding NarL/FixJ family response regulator